MRDPELRAYDERRLLTLGDQLVAFALELPNSAALKVGIDKRTLLRWLRRGDRRPTSVFGDFAHRYRDAVNAWKERGSGKA